MKKREKIFIIPTQYGFMYAFGIFVSLIGGAVYRNNLAFMLCFFLVALFLIGMVQTHSNLKKINIEKLVLFLSPSESVGHGVIWLKSHNSEGHSQIRIQCRDNDDLIDIHIDSIFKNSLHPQYFDFKTGTWGKKSIEKLRVSTRYPFGFFYVWRNFKLKTDYSIFPKPSGEQALKPTAQGPREGNVSYQKDGHDFSEHKKYVQGDSMKHIDWKAYARGRDLLTKHFNEGQKENYILDYDLALGSEERRFRQLSSWIHHCSEKKLAFSMKVGESKIPTSFGERHKARCLRLLASKRVIP